MPNFDNMSNDDFYNMIKEKYCEEYGTKDEGLGGVVNFTVDGERLDDRFFVFFVKGFEIALDMVRNGELDLSEKEAVENEVAPFEFI
jgi:hypothetical protein